MRNTNQKRVETNHDGNKRKGEQMNMEREEKFSKFRAFPCSLSHQCFSLHFSFFHSRVCTPPQQLSHFFFLILNLSLVSGPSISVRPLSVAALFSLQYPIQQLIVHSLDQEFPPAATSLPINHPFSFWSFVSFYCC